MVFPAAGASSATCGKGAAGHAPAHHHQHHRQARQHHGQQPGGGQPPTAAAAAATAASAAEPPQAPSVRREPLKRRRSLSSYYVSKSQSFNCMQDLLKDSAFSRSSLLLAKRSCGSLRHAAQPPRSFSSISEEEPAAAVAAAPGEFECTSPCTRTPAASPACSAGGGAAPQQLALPTPPASPFASCRLQRHSWDASSALGRHSPDPFSASSPLHCSLSATEVPQPPPLPPPQQQQQQWQHAGAALAAQPAPASASALGLRSDEWDPAGSPAGSSMVAESACWFDCTADSLCAALQTAHLLDTVGFAAPCGLAHGVVVGADEMHH